MEIGGPKGLCEYETFPPQRQPKYEPVVSKWQVWSVLKRLGGNDMPWPPVDKNWSQFISALKSDGYIWSHDCLKIRMPGCLYYMYISHNCNSCTFGAKTTELCHHEIQSKTHLLLHLRHLVGFLQLLRYANQRPAKVDLHTQVSRKIFWKPPWYRHS